MVQPPGLNWFKGFSDTFQLVETELDFSLLIGF